MSTDGGGLSYVEGAEGEVRLVKDLTKSMEDLDVFDSDDDDNDDDNDDTLRQIAARACKRIQFGAAILPKPLFGSKSTGNDHSHADDDLYTSSNTQTTYAKVCAAEFNSVVIEHHLKWAPLCVAEPGPLLQSQPCTRLGRYDFYHTDLMVDWALSHDMTVKGHVLVWHVTSPTTILEQLSPQRVKEELKRHIYTTMAHFRGRIKEWDVVNESLAPDGSLADNIFLQKLGPTYIADAFRWAHDADPDAILFYNDNKVESVDSVKSIGLYNLLADLKAQNVPVHGVGLQAHWNAAGTGRNLCPTPRQVKQQVHKLGQLGLQVHLSELDVRTSQLTDNDMRSEAQSQVYHDLVKAALSESACTGIYVWGVSDLHTWVTHFYYDDEPLLLDEEYKRKPCYYAMRQALQSLVIENVDDHDDWGIKWRKSNNNTGEEEILNGDARPDWEVTRSDDEDDDIDEDDLEAEDQQNDSDNEDNERRESIVTDLPPIS